MPLFPSQLPGQFPSEIRRAPSRNQNAHHNFLKSCHSRPALLKVLITGTDFASEKTIMKINPVKQIPEHHKFNLVSHLLSMGILAECPG